MKIAVLIAERNEPDLKATVANIKANSRAEVRVFSDKKGIGPQAARNRLIHEAAGFDVCIVMDGHMRVKPDTIETAARFAMDNTDTVSCARCFHSDKITFEGTPYHGAILVDKAYGHSANDPQSFVAKWRKEPTTGPIPCVMGAFYVFRRDWYIDGIQSPWQFGTGWGCDEEIISAATWLRGGSVNILPVDVWHRYRTPKEVPYKISEAQSLGVWANRLRVLAMLPMSKEQRSELFEHMKPHHDLETWAKLNKQTNTPEVTAYRHFLAAGPMTYDQFAANIMNTETPTMGRKPKTQKAPKTPHPMTTTMEMQTPLTEPPKKLANWGAEEGPRACPHCGESDATVRRTMDDGTYRRRYRVCNHCSKNFVTRDPF